ncbi:hypothetical protein HN51_049706 [Arachis hypogaea]|uniref:Cysteine proteinase inhibitor n=1 Tax=Arachis hypogaea TaxID=3818 RepID=A0A444YE63_ARAHY|nr:cysteine proteinase inhibitor [Arachis ipaensis]XP_025668325.1 cysteine proteinase inhibitor [Arachis hypogaea]QHN91305.1 Cysteine proteinase inhibitor [Arachis hypogaea]RYR00224.1 hypothetical protein Ahy_B07g088328 isoform C [Arachis hypogaea]
MATLGGNRVVEGSQNSIEIQNLARFALEEHNKNSNSSLELVRVISAKKQVVAGSIYEITMEAKDGDEKKQVYEAKVLVKPWLNFKELQEFKLVTDDDNENDNDNAASVSRALI